MFRYDNDVLWGSTPFSVGMWVGAGSYSKQVGRHTFDENRLNKGAFPRH